VIAAIKDAEARRIILVDRRCTNAKAPAQYALNEEYLDWVTGKLPLTSTSQSPLTSTLVNHALPDQSTTVDQTSQVLVPATPTERNLKETLKKAGGRTKPEKRKSNVPSIVVNPLPKETSEGLSDFSQGGRVPPFGQSPPDRRERSSYRQRIVDFLTSHAESSAKAISEGTEIPCQMVYLTLHNGKGKCFRHFKERRTWANLDAGVTTPNARAEPSCRERIIDYLASHGRTSAKVISEDLGIAPNTLRVTLWRGSSKDFCRFAGQTWANLDPEKQPYLGNAPYRPEAAVPYERPYTGR
jgi:hypothetical protein